jgi:hypothetical protein
LYYAQRVKLRAIERLGELLSEFKDPEERKRVQKEQGIAPITAANAMNVAAVEKRVLDQMIDGTKKPSTLRRIANFGSQTLAEASMAFFSHRCRESRIKPTAADQAERLVDYLSSVVTDLDSFTEDYCGNYYEPVALGRAIMPDDIKMFRDHMNTILAFLDEVESGIPECDPRQRGAVG